MDRSAITPALVAGLVARQFPQWADLPVVPVALDGWDNVTFRLGSTLSVRLPSAATYAAQVDKEQRWLPFLGARLPLAVPVPVARGEPDLGFPRPWSVYGWIEGATASPATVSDPVVLATDLARVLDALYACDTAGGPPAGGHSHRRGGPVAALDTETRGVLERLAPGLDVAGATEVWEAALAATAPTGGVWVHGDVTGTNLLVREGRLCAVIDFGCCAVGDPACDTTVAWTLFSGPSRRAFVETLGLDAGAWARGRGWALWKALLELYAERHDPGHGTRVARRMGWRRSPRQLVDDLVADHGAAS